MNYWPQSSPASRVVTTGAGTPQFDIPYHSTTGLFFDYPDDAIPAVGKTGTAQGKTTRGMTPLHLPRFRSTTMTRM